MGKWDRERAREWLGVITQDIILMVGNLNIINSKHISGSLIPLKRLCCLLVTHKYVHALVLVNEDHTSLECNACHFQGTLIYMENGNRREWRLKLSGRCGVW